MSTGDTLNWVHVPQRLHPPFFRRLAMTHATAHTIKFAKDIMTPEPVSVELGMTIREVARIFEEHEISGAPVVDGGGRLVGVVSRTDLVRRYTEDSDPDPGMLIELFGSEDDDEEATSSMASRSITVDDFMTSDPITASPATPLTDIASLMVGARVHRVIIIDRLNIPVGIVTSLDMVKALAGI
jgi:CBS domain-containing protein